MFEQSNLIRKEDREVLQQGGYIWVGEELLSRIMLDVVGRVSKEWIIVNNDYIDYRTVHGRLMSVSLKILEKRDELVKVCIKN